MGGRRKKRGAGSVAGGATPHGAVVFGMTPEQAAAAAGVGVARAEEAPDRPWLGWVLHMGGVVQRELDVQLGNGVVRRTWRLPAGTSYEAEVWHPDEGSPHRLVMTRRKAGVDENRGA